MITEALRVLMARKILPYKFISARNREIIPDNISKNTGIYIHIPFCRTICNFCPYNKIMYNEQLALEYSRALLDEIRLAKRRYPLLDINSVYIGGGTPALLKDNLGSILEEIRTLYNFKGDVAIELHPKDCDKDTLSYIKNIGINMISLGLQSFNDSALKFLCRDYTYQESFLSLNKAKEVGFESIDVDLLFGLDGISVDLSLIHI